MYSRKYIVVVSLLFLVYFINGVIAIPRLSITYDEGDHLNYAARIVRGHPEKVRPFDDASTMPISVLNTIPRDIEQLRNPSLAKKDDGASDIYAGRYITLLISAFIGLFILKWSSDLYGQKAGIFSLFLFVFCPDLAGQSILVTTDSYSALLTISTAYYFWKLINANTWKNLIFFSVSIAVAQLTKQSLTHLLIIFPFITILYVLIRRRDILNKKDFYLKGIVFCLIVISVINAGFLFQGVGHSLSDYHFRSSSFNQLKHSFSIIANVPIPLPAPYIEGLDLTKNLDDMGPGHVETSGFAYMFGQYSATGFWYYYFIVFFFKTPLSVLFFTFLLIYQYFKERAISFRREFVLLFVIAYFLLYFNFLYNSQVGIRHVIMIFPLWFVLLGHVADWAYSRKVVMWASLIYSLATFYYYYPNLIAYSNELLFPKRSVYRVMASSNLDYGQSGYFILDYLKDHPDVRMASETPVAGKCIIGVNNYLDLYKTGKYAWLRKFKPVAQVCHSYLLFEITEEEFK